MIRKLISFCLIVCLQLGVGQAIASAHAATDVTSGSKKISAISYNDLKSTHWAYGYIEKLSLQSVIAGYVDGSFRPEGTISRAEFAKMIALATDIATSTPTKSTFIDVPDAHWAMRYIEAARNHGIIGGYPDGTFKPDNKVTRAEIAKMVILAGKFEANKAGTPLSDISGNWAYDHIMTAKNLNIIGGYPDGSFGPEKNATRAEASKIITKALIDLLKEIAQAIDKPMVKITSPTDKGEYALSTDSISLSGIAASKDSLSAVTWANNLGGQGTAQGTTSWFIPKVTLKEGTNIITVTAKDNKENTASASLKVTYTLSGAGGGGGAGGGNDVGPNAPSVHSVFATTKPTIDGILSLGEWGTPAISKTLSYLNETHQMHVYFKNDAKNLYIAATIDNEDVPGIGTFDFFMLAFDNNNNGKPDTNEDIKAFHTTTYYDGHFADSTGNTIARDSQTNGNAQAVYLPNSAAGAYTYEFEIPLDASDVQDSKIGNSVGLYIFFGETILDLTTSNWTYSGWDSWPTRALLWTDQITYGKIYLASQ